MTLGKMLRLMAGSLGLRIAGAGLGFLTQLVVTRNFEPSDVGVIFLGMSVAAVASLFAAVGYPLLALTQLPRFFALGAKRAVHAFHGTFLRDLAFGCAMLFAAALLLEFTLPMDAGTKLAIGFGVASALPSAFVRYNSCLANSMRLYQGAYIPDFIVRPALFLGFVLYAAWSGHGLFVAALLGAYVLSNAVVAVVQAYVVRAEGITLADWFAVRPSFTAALRKRSFALAIVGAVTVMFADIVTLLGGWFLPHGQLAVLGLTVRLAAIAGFVIQATQQFILPDLTEAITMKQDDKANDLLMRLNLLTAATLAIGLVFAIVFGGWILSLFGPVYAEGHLLLVLLLIGQSIRALSGMNQNLMSIGGRQLRSAAACLIGMVLFAGSWAMLAPSLGLMAAGVAVILAELCWAILLASQAQSQLGRRGDLLWLVTRR